ncbi:MAG: class I SAM-dependent methyltransferase [Gammaproteobacteria bacterium]
MLAIRPTLFAAVVAGAVAITSGCASADASDSMEKSAKRMDGSSKRVLQTIADGDHRSDKNRARNASRNPAETLSFFGIQPNMTVVEIAPGGGWYTEILAPYLKQDGVYYAGHYDPNHEREYFRTSVGRYSDKLAANPKLYGAVKLTVFSPPDTMDAAPDGSADMVVTFRNTHGWMRNGSQDAVFSAMHRYLKPGGILGVVQHRGDASKPQDPKAASGYVRQDEMIKMAEKAGFKLVATSEINANPKDTADHPKGVWNLPPGYRDGDENRARYAAIGESDRMTLKFVKQ